MPIMNTLTKTDTIDTLGLPQGDHWVRFHVEKDVISFEVAGSSPVRATTAAAPLRMPTGFVEKWGGSVMKLDDPGDSWLTHINEKHLR